MERDAFFILSQVRMQAAEDHFAICSDAAIPDTPCSLQMALHSIQKKKIKVSMYPGPLDVAMSNLEGLSFFPSGA